MVWLSSWLSRKQRAVKHKNLAHIIVLVNLQWFHFLNLFLCVLTILPQTITQEIPKRSMLNTKQLHSEKVNGQTV